MSSANLSVCISSSPTVTLIFCLLNFYFIFYTCFSIYTLNNTGDIEHSCLMPFLIFAVVYLFSILFLLSISQIIAVVVDHQQVLKERRQNTPFSHIVVINKPPCKLLKKLIDITKRHLITKLTNVVTFITVGIPVRAPHHLRR